MLGHWEWGLSTPFGLPWLLVFQFLRVQCLFPSGRCRSEQGVHEIVYPVGYVTQYQPSNPGTWISKDMLVRAKLFQRRWSRVTCHHLFLTGSRECRGVRCAAVAPDPTILCGPEKGGFWAFQRYQTWCGLARISLTKVSKREHINLRQSSISPVLIMLASKRNVHHFLLIKAEKERLKNWRNCGQVCQRRSSFDVQSRHLWKDENLCCAGILKTASREIWTGFIRKCMGPKRGAIHAQKQRTGSWLI